MSIQVYGRASDTRSCVYHLADNLNNSGPGIGLTLGGDNESFIYGSSGGKWGNYIQCSWGSLSQGEYPCLSSKWNIDPLATDFYLDFWVRFPQSVESNLYHFKGLGFVINDNNAGKIVANYNSDSSLFQYQDTDYLASAGAETPWKHFGFAGIKRETNTKVVLFVNGIPFAGVIMSDLPAPEFGHSVYIGTPGSEPGSIEFTRTCSQTEFSEIHFTQCLPEISNYKRNPSINDIKKWRLPVPSAAYTGSEQWIGWQYLSGRKIYDGTAWQTLKATDRIYLNGAWHELGGCSHVWVPVIDAATGSKRLCTACGYLCQHPSIFTGTCPVCGYPKGLELSELRRIVAGNKGKTYTTELSVFGSLDSSATWIGGVLAENGKIYGIPHGAAEILIIDTATDTVTTIPTESGDLKWFGGCLAPNGKIYAIPHTSNKVLVIDPETDTTYTFSTISGDRKWAGGVLGPDGKIYCLPCQEYRIGVIDPETDTLETFGNVELNISWSWKWIGGVLGPDNCIYAFPSNYQNKYVLKIDPVARTTQLIEHGISASGELFQSSVFAPDGQLWGVTCYYDKLVSYSTDTGTVTIHGDVRSGNGKWVGGCLAPNGKLYFAPLNSGSILEVDPDTGSSVEIPIDTALESGNKFRGCVLAPNGSVYFIPCRATSALKLSFTGGLTPFPAEVCESPWLNKF